MTRGMTIRNLSVFSLVVMVFTMLFGVNTVSAESGQAFSISPPVVELKANRGDEANITIKLTNLSSGPLSIAVETNDFGAKNETGEPNIIFDDSGKDSIYTLKDWVVIPNDFTIQSKETRSVTFPITIPANAEPGGHYGVIRFTGTTAGGDSQQVALSASIGSLVLLQVNGTITTSASIEDFYTANADFSKNSFFESSPLQVVSRIKNTGNVHIKPTGTVEITDMFGKKISTIRMNGDPNDEKNRPGSILPQSIRRFNSELKDMQLFGRYTATMKLTYGDGKTLEKSTEVWVVPYRQILIVLAVLAILAVGLVFGLKRYNAYIIKKAHSPKQ